MTPIPQPIHQYKILTSGKWAAGQVVIRWFPQRQTLQSAVQQKIDSYWQENILNTAKKEFVYNGDLCSLKGWQKNKDKLILDLGLTNYKEHIYSNFVNEPSNHPANFTSRALGISLVLLTKDDYLVLTQRSQAVGECPGLLDVIGGHIEPGEHSAAGIPDPFVAIQAELAEEVNFKLRNDEVIQCIGIIETTGTRKPELIFLLNSELTADKIMNAATEKQSAEISKLIAVKNQEREISDFISSNQNGFSPSAIGALELYLAVI